MPRPIAILSQKTYALSPQNKSKLVIYKHIREYIDIESIIGLYLPSYTATRDTATAPYTLKITQIPLSSQNAPN